MTSRRHLRSKGRERRATARSSQRAARVSPGGAIAKGARSEDRHQRAMRQGEAPAIRPRRATPECGDVGHQKTWGDGVTWRGHRQWRPSRLRRRSAKSIAKCQTRGAPSLTGRRFAPELSIAREANWRAARVIAAGLAWRGPTAKLQFEVRPQRHIKPRALCVRRGEPHHEEGQQ